MDEVAVRAFERLVSDPQAVDLELDRAALAMSRAFDPQLDVDAELLRLDELADELSGEATDVRALAIGLFDRLGYTGNRLAYYELDNSLLHRVVARRLGIPITLSLLFIEVGRRLGHAIEGVGMPGHFLARSQSEYFDGFHGSGSFDAAACDALHRRLFGGAGLPPNALVAVSPGDLLRRMLNNIGAIGRAQSDRDMVVTALALKASFGAAPLGDLVAAAKALGTTGRFVRAAELSERAAALGAADGLEASAIDALSAQAERWRAQLN